MFDLGVVVTVVHNVLPLPVNASGFVGGLSKLNAAESVNLELDFGNNEWYTKAATYVAYGLGAF